MATESPLFHDGSQCTAGANYSNTAGLLGNGGSAQFYAVFISAARTVTLQTTAGGQVYGILQNKPALGDAADVGFFGVSKVLAGATIAAGVDLMVNASGLLITWAAGGANTKVGFSYESAVVGQVFTAFIYGPGGPKVLT